MGFVLTLVYIVLTIISPGQFGQVFASYHPMVYLAGVAALASLPSMLANIYLRSAIQTQLLLGFIVAIILSQVANGRFEGAIESLPAILPSVAVFFFIVTNVTTVRRLKTIVMVTIVTCLGVAVEGLCGYYGGYRGDMFVALQTGQVSRLRAAGFLNDPNDFAQILLIALPLIFVGWNRGRAVVNSIVVFVPAIFLLWTIYLTHSRGALIALGVLGLITYQDKIGKTASAVLAGALVFGMIVLGFTGGRGISAAEGADRLEAWSQGLQLFKSAPLFGIGFGRFTDVSDITAHNSFVLCLAELGLVGSTIFVALLVTTLMNLDNMINSETQLYIETNSTSELERAMQANPSEGAPFSSELHAATVTVTACDPMTSVVADQEELVLKPFAVVMRLALASFITTSMFLSRTYTPTMYLVLGLATATIGLQQPAIELGDRRRWVFFTLAVEGLAIVLIYCAVRFRY
jgi:putative inorganic carbon (hco3(-)) transporter